ncbi:SDR family oxidoreductase [Streptomyces diastatochromogenes]|uniref:Dehydrogenase n=1 Tax=Streptomyces diastatochromogenes TaxID=42236 RepID=A0A233RQQ3_STRDA|nr:SDR family oxidoreductase [Streptomyces diastatochromogenes]MCZ0984740.1 SDR family oxidoreductase [Streptomyces diastatochromogenes]OXY85726.1 dehydrogenase [Streptomyces diastatochromogenes]
MTSSTTSRIALVTGANKGVGRAITRQLAELGLTVWLGARDTERGQRAEAELRGLGLDVRFVHLDVTDEASVALAAKHIEQNGGRLDALVNNAGISRPWLAPSETPIGNVRASLETNVVGVVNVTNAMLPLLRRSDAARIVNISSVLGSITAAAENHDPTSVFPDGGFPATLGYTMSKAAVNSLTVHYANELRAEGILVNAVSPNWVPTDANDNTGILTLEQGARMPVRMATLPVGGPTGTFVCSDATGDGVILPW